MNEASQIQFRQALAAADRTEELERENKELRKANEILKLASAFFCPGGARPPSEVLKGFIDQHRQAYWVESICKALQIAPSGYWRHAAYQRNPQLRFKRYQRDDTLRQRILKE